MPKLKISEDDIQITLIDWTGWQKNRLPGIELLHHIPNGGHRNKVVAAKLKAMGVKPGVSDLFLPVARLGYHGMYIELKSATGRISDEQANWINRVRAEGYAAFVCYSVDEAKERLEWYLYER